MDNTKIIIGAILSVVAIALLIGTLSPDTTVRYLGGAIVGILGLAFLATGFKEK